MPQLFCLNVRVTKQLHADTINSKPAAAIVPCDISDLVLRPLSLLRNLTSVDLQEPSDEVAQRLRSLMMQSSPPAYLPQMHRLLQRHVYNVPKGGHCETCVAAHMYLSCAEQAMDMHDLATFSYLRDKIMHLIWRHQALDRVCLYTHDPQPDEPGESILDAFDDPIREEALRLVKAEDDYLGMHDQED